MKGVDKLGRVWLLVACVSSNIPCNLTAANGCEDHLVPPSPYSEMGSSATYRKVYEKKLFVVPGDFARFVHLPGPLAHPEAVVSIYKQAPKQNRACEYGITLTRPSARIWDAIEHFGQKPEVDLQSIRVTRWDASLPESTALAVRGVWLRGLRKAAPDPCVGCFVEGSEGIFSLTDSDGHELRAEFPAEPKECTRTLIEIAHLLIDYCYASASSRPKLAKEVEKLASSLEAKLSRARSKKP